MSSHIVEVVPFTLEPCPNADRLSIAKVKGWQCLVRTEDFKDVNKGIYIPIDSVVPDTSMFSFLDLPNKDTTMEEHCAKLSAENSIYVRPKYRRIKTIKLRGVISQGLLLPVKNCQYKIGDNVADELKITKYEPPVDNSTYSKFGSPGSPFLTENPEYFHKYTDIENIKNFPDIFEEGEEVIYTEKIHGCLYSETRITMSDGSSKPIRLVEPGEYILGVDSNNNVIPTKVIHKFNNGYTDQWVRVRGTRRAVGRGNNFFSIICTPNHQFYSNDKYVSADSLKQGDPVTLVRSEIMLCPLQKTVTCNIISVEKHDIKQKTKWDLETETHNFFANKVLVHNSNFRAGIIKNTNGNYDLVVGSHNKRHIPIITSTRYIPYDKGILKYISKLLPFIKKKDIFTRTNPFFYWNMVWSLGEEELKTKLISLANAYDANSVIVFGEVFGKSVQDLTYDRDTLDLRIFDISINGNYLDWDVMSSLTKQFLDLDVVPILGRGPFSKEELTKYTNGKSTLAPNQIREGCVIKPIEERWHANLGRVVLKSISEDYLLRKGGSEDH